MGRKDLQQVTHRFVEYGGYADYETQYFTDTFYARPKGMRYPGGTKLAYEYDSAGYPTSEKDPVSSFVYRQVTDRNARNQTLSASLGNGSMSQVSVYNTPTGQMKSHTVSAGSQIVNLGYDYDLYGNLSDADTTVNGITSSEAFDYDYLHRLQMSYRYTPGGNQTITYSYDAAGNIKSKSDYATNYSYTGPGPNAVSSVSLVAGGSASFWYDGNGNMKTGHGKSMTYNAFNKPLTIKVGSTLVDAFSYGADLMRYRHQKNGGKVTWYLDKYMEIVTVGSTTDYRHYLGDVAILTKTGSLSDQSPEIEFVHRDRLGSAAVLTDESGGNVRGRGFDPFGKPRNENWSDRSPPTLGRSETERGFTDHEHLDDAQLIHMNGRVYDYNLGRFLSVDPIIQAPGNSQGLNPYSYIRNNPLSGTDPSGYCEAVTGSRIKTCENFTVTRIKDGKFAQMTINVNVRNGAEMRSAGASAVAQLRRGNDQTAIGGLAARDEGGGGANGATFDPSIITSGGNYSKLSAEKKDALNTAVLTGWTKYGLDGQFHTEDGAAEAFSNAMNPISMRFNIELGAIIFDTGSGGSPFKLSNPVTSYLENAIMVDVFEIAQRQRAVGDIRTAEVHTHSRSGFGGLSENFSGGAITNDLWNHGHKTGDLPRAVTLGINTYIATPRGLLKKFSFNAYSQEWQNQRPFESYVTTTRTDIETWESN